MIDRVGQQLGNYTLVRLLGRGNFADVYLGTHIHLGTQAAIKVLHGQLADEEVAGFFTEARTIAHLRHPHIVQVLDFGVEDTTPFLVMDYAPGGNLRQRHSYGMRLPLDLVVSYVQQVAQALQYAHQERVIHRDIKPENMLLGRRDELLLSDFGIAMLAQSSRSQQAQETAGTVAYMAPEQIQAHATPASDQYALGIVVYEWLSGERPFHGTLTEIAIKHALAPPPSLSEKVPTFPPEVEHVVLRALAKEPVLRFASVLAFAEALDEASRATSTSFATAPEPLAQPRQSPGRVKEPSHNLPAQVTPMVGREQEVAKACALLQRTEVRLVTLTGAGGIGKTRLGIEVAQCQQDAFADGICFVPLAPLSDPALVVATIAQALGIKEAREQPLLELLHTFLRDKHLLLLLDNFEQVVTAAPLLSDLLAACPQLKLLVTSRAVLHLQGEHEFPVPPLALPDLKHLPDVEALSQSPAVALFLERALATKLDLAITNANMRAIAEICARLDGLPLAIELAAVRVKLLPPQALLHRLERRLPVLTGRAQDVPARQQTLRNTIAWSYHLLDAEEQRLFRRLCIFVGGCTLEAIEFICETLGDRAFPVLEGVASLIDKSLLQRIEQEAGDGLEPRFVMLETIREYGLEALAESQEMESVLQAHATYYLVLAEQAEPELGGPQQSAWLERLEREHDNLRAALSWLLEPGQTGDSVEFALRLAGALGGFWEGYGHWSEGRNFLERALAASEGVAASVRAKALYMLGRLDSLQGASDQAEAVTKEGLALWRELGDARGIAAALRHLGLVFSDKGNLVRARALCEEALKLSREVGDKEGISSALFHLAAMARDQGEYAQARALLEEFLVMVRERRDRRGVSLGLFDLALVLFVSQDDPAAVRSLLEEGFAVARNVGHKQIMAGLIWLSGGLALQQGDVARAAVLGEESVALFREMGDQWSIIYANLLLAQIATRQGEHAAASALYEEGLAIANKCHYQGVIAPCLEGLASMVAAQRPGEASLEDAQWAARLLGAAEALRAATGMPLPPVERAAYEQAVAATRARLGEKNFAARWSEGRSMTAEQVLAARGAAVVAAGGTTAAVPITYPAGLTAREVEVLRLVAQGLTNAQIAEVLVLSEKTVATHLYHIFNKTTSQNRATAVAFALRHGLA